MNIESYCHITNNRCLLNSNELETTSNDASFLTNIYRTKNISYPKFFKMDNLCKAGFLAAELVLEGSNIDKVTPRKDVSIICMNRSSSLDDDTQYQSTIQDSNNYFPSPSVFVYTLANIVTGEIAIRNKIQGESSFYIFEQFSAERMTEIINSAFSDDEINYLICGWIEVLGQSIDVFMLRVNRNGTGIAQPSSEFINKLYNK